MGSTAIDNLTYEYNKELKKVNSNASSLLLDEDEVADAVNYYWSQNGLRPRLGGKNFKTNAQFNGEDVIHLNIYARQDDDFFYFIVGTTGGYLYFIKLSTTSGETTQTPVTDLTLGTDYPTDVYFFDPDNLTDTLERLDTFQYAIFRSPTASITTGTPNYWAHEPALDTSSGIIDTIVFNDVLYIIDGTDNLYTFSGTLGSGNKLTDSSTSIQAKTEVTGTTKFLKLTSMISRVFIATNDSYIHGSLVNDGTSYGATADEYVTIGVGRSNGTKLTDFTNIKNAAIITAQNSQTKTYSSRLLSSDGTIASIRIDGIDERSGIIGGSSVAINQDLIALTNYGFINLQSLGTNERFGLTSQKSISKNINNKIRNNLTPSNVSATYYANDKNWYLCQISNNLVACLSLDYSDMEKTILKDEQIKWTTFIYPSGVKQIKSLFDYLFVVDNENNIVMQDVPGVYKDAGVDYLKRIVSRSFGAKAEWAAGTDKELKNYEKTLKKVKINGIAREIASQTITVTAIKNSGLSGISNLENNAPFNFTLATGLDLGPGDGDEVADDPEDPEFDLDDAVDLFQREESPAFYQAKDLNLTSRTFQIQIDSTSELDLELLDIGVGYTINKEAVSDVDV